MLASICQKQILRNCQEQKAKFKGKQQQFLPLKKLRPSGKKTHPVSGHKYVRYKQMVRLNTFEFIYELILTVVWYC